MRAKTEKTLGILGGMGPAATAEFLRLLAEGAPADCDQEHPRLFMVSDPSIPDRTRAILGEGEDPSPRIRNELERLVACGADLLAVPCNTAHYFIDGFKNALGVPLVHIVEETVKAAIRLAPQGAWLLSTSGTRVSGIYPACAKRRGYSFLEPSEQQQKLAQESLTSVKSGRLDEAGDLLRRVIEELWTEKEALVVTACTELPLAYAASGLPADKEISSLRALSDACIAHLYEEKISPHAKRI